MTKGKKNNLNNQRLIFELAYDSWRDNGGAAAARASRQAIKKGALRARFRVAYFQCPLAEDPFVRELVRRWQDVSAAYRELPIELFGQPGIGPNFEILMNSIKGQ